MHVEKKSAGLCLLLAFILFNTDVRGQPIQFREIALKNGESTELGDEYWINSNCKSPLKGTPEVEILDGPPRRHCGYHRGEVVPHLFGCANPVPGGKLVITARDVQDYSYTRMVVRTRYKT
jgi:hypothetical protein